MEDLPGALRAAQAKLDLLKRCHLLKWSRNSQQLFLDRLGHALVSDLPAAHMEVWSFFCSFDGVFQLFSCAIEFRQHLIFVVEMCSHYEFLNSNPLFRVFEFLAISKALGRQADDPEPHRSTYCCLYMMMKTKLSLHDDTNSVMKAIVNMNIIFTAEYQV